MIVTVYGARGSTPCSCPENSRYGGNTSCIVVEVPDADPLILDLGSGVRKFGEDYLARTDEPFQGTALVTHLHWDHIQGLPFFAPVLKPGASMDVVSIAPESGSLRDAVADVVSPPTFPVTLDMFAGEISFTEVCADGAVDRLEIGDVTVTAFPVEHLGPTCGFRLDWAGRSIVYVPDHQEPTDREAIAPLVIELCRDADVLFHDAQYTDAEFATKADWGHSTDSFAHHLAGLAGVKTLALFHHDPAHSDELIDALVDRERPDASPDCEVVAAYEGLTFSLAARNPPATR